MGTSGPGRMAWTSWYGCTEVRPWPESDGRSCGISTRGADPEREFTESLILAQDERWRRASHMQVERVPQGI